LPQYRLKLVEAHIGGVLAPEPGRAFELGDCGVERMVLVVRGAERPQAGVRLAGDALRQRRSQSRLADAGLAGFQSPSGALKSRILLAMTFAVSHTLRGVACGGYPMRTSRASRSNLI
jgi:hypothetical protein